MAKLSNLEASGEKVYIVFKDRLAFKTIKLGSDVSGGGVEFFGDSWTLILSTPVHFGL